MRERGDAEEEGDAMQLFRALLQRMQAAIRGSKDATTQKKAPSTILVFFHRRYDKRIRAQRQGRSPWPHLILRIFRGSSGSLFRAPCSRRALGCSWDACPENCEIC